MPRLIAVIVLSSLALWSLATTLDAAEEAPAVGKTPIFQNRDEEGRNPYQAHRNFPAGCDVYDCLMRFPKVAKGTRLVITNISCDIAVPSTQTLFDSYLAGSKADPYLRAYPPLMLTAGTSGGYKRYVVNAQVLYYYHPDDTPTFEVYNDGATPPNGDCALSGYVVHIP